MKAVTFTDPIIANLQFKYSLQSHQPSANLFQDICESIVGQQLSVKAADTIIKRFVGIFGDFPKPLQIIEADTETLRSAGLSYAKVKYVKNLSEAVHAGSLDLKSLANLDDEAVIVELTKIKGIGRWTAEMILIFSLARPDVFSIGDLGLRNAISKLYSLNREDLPAISKLASSWAPNRSLASRLLWKSLDNLPK